MSLKCLIRSGGLGWRCPFTTHGEGSLGNEGLHPWACINTLTACVCICLTGEGLFSNYCYLQYGFRDLPFALTLSYSHLPLCHLYSFFHLCTLFSGITLLSLSFYPYLTSPSPFSLRSLFAFCSFPLISNTLLTALNLYHTLFHVLCLSPPQSV